MTSHALVAGFAVALLSATAANGQSPDTTRYTILMAKGPSGFYTAWTEADGTRSFHFEYNDRGRGPALTERMKIGPDGYPTLVDIEGQDYYKGQVSERFIVERSGTTMRARWKNRAESTSVVLDTLAYYLSMNGASIGVLELLLLATPEHRVRLLPQGEARLERIRDTIVQHDSTTQRVTLYATHGFGAWPDLWWVDETGKYIGFAGTWFSVLRRGFEGAVPALLAVQAAYDSARGADLAKKIIRVPTRPTVFTRANLFDSESGTMRPRTTVVVTGNRITAVGADGAVAIPPDADVVDAAGKTLMPGLWDMHVHAGDDAGLLYLAAGVTTVRDLANDLDETVRRRKRFDARELIGPRMLLAGFMDGPGPFAGPTKVLISNADSARAWVNRYADLGYAQIKVYSSLDTALVPVIVAAAHQRGLRVSGHVPQGMTAEEFVRAGADELQHANFLFLNFWRDSVKDTRTPERFTYPAQHAALLDLRSPRVRSFVQLLRDRRVVIDPTLVIFESMLLGRPGKVNPGQAAYADRLPPLWRRGLTAGGGLPTPDSLDQRYRDSFAAFGRMVKTMYDAGVPIVAGTDAAAGFGLHRELELYVAAGIPPWEVLRFATINGARVMGRDAELGSIAPGKLADLILVDGRPEQRIADIRRVTFVMKDGAIYDPAAMYRAVNVKPAVP